MARHEGEEEGEVDTEGDEGVPGIRGEGGRVQGEGNILVWINIMSSQVKVSSR